MPGSAANIIESPYWKLDRLRGWLAPSGRWTLHNLSAIEDSFKTVQFEPFTKLLVSGEQLKELDTAGAMLICQFALKLAVPPPKVERLNFNQAYAQVLDLVFNRLNKQPRRFLPSRELSIIELIGKKALDVASALVESLGFLGQVLLGLGKVMRQPSLFRLKEFFVQLELVCVDAIAVVSLVAFLIGVVIAYLLAMQIQKYGANIFIVDGVSLAMCRELSPIIVAIIMAGRSGSAFTAQLGAMKLNEEIDALVALGLSPVRVLVLPRVLALVVSMPLLVFVGNAVGIAGGMLIADSYLGITFPTFVERLQSVLPLRALMVGLIKAPVFALVIGLIGCRMGLSVENNARSVGLNTTSTVVQSIVSVILLNAAFAVLFANLKI